ncbi:MAG TPA: hypothetical protein VF573_18485 [Paraburkholderia sp.]|uniref:hypothetical protein n=1 Tax=Paraburkholderia sp. TaxID=1926495 RepID=UPI002ED5EA1E
MYAAVQEGFGADGRENVTVRGERRTGKRAIKRAINRANRRANQRATRSTVARSPSP